MKKNSQHIKNKKKKNKPKSKVSPKIDRYPSGSYEYPPGEVPLIWPDGFWNSLISDVSDVCNNKKILNNDDFIRSEEYNICECCREKLKKENYVWDTDLLEYVPLRKDGTPHKNKKLTEADLKRMKLI
jgi:hypothetical protein